MKTRRFLAEKFFLKILYLPLWKVLRRENKNNHVPSTFLVWVADLYKTAGSIRSTDVSGCEQPKYFLVPRSCFLYLQYTYIIHNTIHRKMWLNRWVAKREWKLHFTGISHVGTWVGGVGKSFMFLKVKIWFAFNWFIPRRKEKILGFITVSVIKVNTKLLNTKSLLLP